MKHCVTENPEDDNDDTILSRVKGYCRILDDYNEEYTDEEHEVMWQLVDSQTLKMQDTKTFRCQHFYQEPSSTMKIYDTLGTDVLQSLLNGYNTSVIEWNSRRSTTTTALCQRELMSSEHLFYTEPTKSNCLKAFGLLGGILFDIFGEPDTITSLRVVLSAWDVKNDNVTDLLSSSTSEATLMTSSVFDNPTTIECLCLKDALDAISKSRLKKRTAPIDHSIVRVLCYSQLKSTVSTLHLVDLLGQQHRILKDIVTELSSESILLQHNPEIEESTVGKIVLPILNGNSITHFLTSIQASEIGSKNTLETLELLSDVQQIPCLCTKITQVPKQIMFPPRTSTSTEDKWLKDFTTRKQQALGNTPTTGCCSLESSNPDYQALLSVVKEQQTREANLETEIGIRKSNQLDECITHEIHIDTIKLENIRLKRTIRHLKTESLLPYAFNEYESDIDSLEKELELIRAENLSLLLRGSSSESTKKLKNVSDKYEVLRKECCELRERKRKYIVSEKLLGDSFKQLEDLNSRVNQLEKQLYQSQMDHFEACRSKKKLEGACSELALSNSDLETQLCEARETIASLNMQLTAFESEKTKTLVLNKFLSRHCTVPQHQTHVTVPTENDKKLQNLRKLVKCPKALEIINSLEFDLQKQALELQELVMREKDLTSALVEQQPQKTPCMMTLQDQIHAEMATWL